MISRRQLTVASPIDVRAVFRAFARSIVSGAALPPRASELIRERYGAQRVVLTDSGTSALVVALRLAAGDGGVVGYPGYACVDLAAAARRAGVRVKLYDIDPVTLSPDLASVEQLLRRGVDAIVVAHLFGYPANVPAVRELARSHGVTVIEDAAQGADATLSGARLGTLGDLGVLSFGRGKGLCAGGGGALMSFDARWSEAVEGVQLAQPARGWSGLATTLVQWGLGRPSLYELPARIPWLHLGEMVFHDASEPRALTLASSSLLDSALALADAELALRRAHAAMLDVMVARATDVVRVTALRGARPGYLRYAVRDEAGARAPRTSLGIVQPYPATLAEQLELRPVLMPGEPSTPGATLLRKSLYTLPTHGFVTHDDVRAMESWLSS